MLAWSSEMAQGTTCTGERLLHQHHGLQPRSSNLNLLLPVM